MTDDFPALQAALRESQVHTTNHAPMCICDPVEYDTEPVVIRKPIPVWVMIGVFSRWSVQSPSRSPLPQPSGQGRTICG